MQSHPGGLCKPVGANQVPSLSQQQNRHLLGEGPASQRQETPPLPPPKADLRKVGHLS